MSSWLALSLDDVDKWAGIIEAAATTVAIVVGGVWAYYRFFKDRVYRPRVQLGLDAGLVTKSNQRVLVCRLTVKNMGNTQITLQHGGTGLRIWTPAAQATSPNAWVLVVWARQVTGPILEAHDWIESDETVSDELVVRPPSDMGPGYLVEARVVLRRRTRGNIVVSARSTFPPDKEWAGSQHGPGGKD
jgi:hypothetical protein